MESNEYYIDSRPITDLKVVELRKELEKRSLSKSGNKKELYDRLRDYLQNNPDDYSYQENITSDQMVSNPLVAQYLATQKEALEAARRSTYAEREELVAENSSPHMSEFDHTASFDNHKISSEVIETLSSHELPAAGKMPLYNDQVDIVKEQLSSENTYNLTENEDADAYTISLSENKVDQNETVTFSENVLAESSRSCEHIPSINDELSATEFVENKCENSNELKNIRQSPQQQCDLEHTPIHENFETVVSEGDAEKELRDTLLLERSEKPFADDELDYDQEDDAESDHDSNAKRRKIESPRTPETVAPLPEEEAAVLVTNEKLCDLRFEGHPNMSKSSEISDGLTRVKASSPARHPVSRWIHIRGLKRPFTQRSFVEMLMTYGKILEEEMWLDSIKSTCIVAYSNEDEAVLARERLHNCIWPQSSDSFLSIEFSSEETFKRRKDQSSSVGNERLLVVVDSNSKPKDEQITVTVKNDSSSKKRKADDHFKPQKTLEDLFRKTKTQPALYYLPLTDEEVSKRARERKVHSQKRPQPYYYNNGRRK